MDLLHEFELGVWKATFTHSIRIIIALKEGKGDVLNGRFVILVCIRKSTLIDFVLLPTCAHLRSRYHTFSSNFHRNASLMKKFAARDSEDILQVCHRAFRLCIFSASRCLCTNVVFTNIQCAVPAFEGLFSDEHNKLYRTFSSTFDLGTLAGRCAFT